jgi:hypothetical protein
MMKEDDEEDALYRKERKLAAKSRRAEQRSRGRGDFSMPLRVFHRYVWARYVRRIAAQDPRLSRRAPDGVRAREELNDLRVR